ncbi:MAG: hypothetical protein PF590_06520 [Candidatus Delongbacteria bacterium]|nr:hypothetical protein [Candidatus Delongbacteria bacterium]
MKGIRTLVLIIVFGLSLTAGAQPTGTLYVDAGENNVSEGFYLNTAVLGSYHYDKYSFVAGSAVDLIGPGSNVLTNFMFMPGRAFIIGNFPFKMQGVYMFNRSFDWVHEMNLGVLINIERSHFSWKLGSEFRTYYLTREACETCGDESNKALHENWNIMYFGDYRIKPRGNAWNVSLALTNLDYFLINQEANPMFFLRGKYDISSNLRIFSEAWYKSAGAFNISVNYFGFFIRTGITWQPNIEK